MRPPIRLPPMLSNWRGLRRESHRPCQSNQGAFPSETYRLTLPATIPSPLRFDYLRCLASCPAGAAERSRTHWSMCPQRLRRTNRERRNRRHQHGRSRRLRFRKDPCPLRDSFPVGYRRSGHGRHRSPAAFHSRSVLRFQRLSPSRQRRVRLACHRCGLAQRRQSQRLSRSCPECPCRRTGQIANRSRRGD